MSAKNAGQASIIIVKIEGFEAENPQQIELIWLGRVMGPKVWRRPQGTGLFRAGCGFGFGGGSGGRLARSALPPLGPGRHVPALAGACRLAPVPGVRFRRRASYRGGSALPRAEVGPLGQASADRSGSPSALAP